MQSDKVRVEYISTHYNHTKQLGHLRLSNTTRLTIASKLQQGITSQRILDDIRDTQHVTHIIREQLLSRKDITNI